ncbi:serine aminopeptidase domain-containing protein [Demequina oxidasica]|uniref:serine aminopeptidase domain-containing protein n=1 Tax=Demequina oxidasica TaxID=676199 RepID=UPI000785C291|nr:alpha/beta hydrolase [Demequina oxidasica]
MDKREAPVNPTATVMDWHPDILEGYEAARLPEPTRTRRNRGAVRTLVRRIDQPAHPRGIVVHVHGRNDYYFQTHVADAFAGHGLAFYAVDMRRAGRSLQPDELPHHFTRIAELGEDITAAIDAAVADAGDLPVIVHSHSTGALGAAIWASDVSHPNLAGVILNSPLFGLRLKSWKAIGIELTPVIGAVAPTLIMDPAPTVYTQRLAAQDGGGWVFDGAWKKSTGEPATAGWLGATVSARRRVAKGLSIEVPVLVAHADSTGPDKFDNPRVDSQDTVVDVDPIRKSGPGLGANVTMLEVAGAMHDVSLSAPGPRQVYFDAVTQWLDSILD